MDTLTSIAITRIEGMATATRMDLRAGQPVFKPFIDIEGKNKNK